jgi:uncharacterized membrane protein YbhN (UPF0104 family)
MKTLFFKSCKDFYLRHKNIISYFCLGVITLLYCFYFRGRSDEFSVFLSISINDIVILIAASVVFKLIWGYIFKVLLRFFEVDLEFLEWFGLTNISVMINYFLPAKGGLMGVAVYLKKKYQLNYTHFLSSMTGFYGITFLVNALAGMILSLLVVRIGPFYENKILIFFSIVSACILASMMIVRLPKGDGLFQRYIRGLHQFADNRKYLPELVFTQVGLILAIGIRIFFAFKVLGVDIGFMSSMLIALMACFSMFFSVTPASLGVKEFFITFSGTVLGVAPEKALAAAILDRCVDIVISFVLGSLSFWVMTRKKNFTIKGE